MLVLQVALVLLIKLRLKRSHDFNVTYLSIVLRSILRAFGHPVMTCATCWVLLAQIWKWSNFLCNICGCCMMLYSMARFVQQCCARACALVQFSISSMHKHVTTEWPNARNMLRPTTMRYIASKRSDRLAGACKCWTNNVGICCVEMLRLFGRVFKS